VDPIRPIARSDRAVQPVELQRLRPLEREEDKQRRERERKRRQPTPRTPENAPVEPDSGIDVRV
jgi:hypothetical protein